ncbi:hypothetical protein [Thermococcus sp.]
MRRKLFGIALLFIILISFLDISPHLHRTKSDRLPPLKPEFRILYLSLPLTQQYEKIEIWNGDVIVYANSSLYIYDFNRSVSYRLVNVSKAFLTNFGVFFVYNGTCYNLFHGRNITRIKCSDSELFVFQSNQLLIAFNGSSMKFRSRIYRVSTWGDEVFQLFKLSDGYVFVLYSPKAWKVTLMFFNSQGNLLWSKVLSGDLIHYQVYEGKLFINIGSVYLSLPPDYGLYEISSKGTERITHGYKCFSKFEFTVYNDSIHIANQYEVTECSLDGNVTKYFDRIKWFVSGNTLSDFGWHGLLKGNYLLVDAKDAVSWENIYLCKYQDKCIKLCRAKKALPIGLWEIGDKIVAAYQCGNRKLLKVWKVDCHKNECWLTSYRPDLPEHPNEVIAEEYFKLYVNENWLSCCNGGDVGSSCAWANRHCGGCFAPDASRAQNFAWVNRSGWKTIIRW